MLVIASPQEVNSYVSDLILAGKQIGLVPTMGALHEGHFSLVRRSRQENDVTIVSIFVNPRQFNNAEDLANYPRPIQTDLEALKQLGVEMVYTPTVEAMYPQEPKASVHLGKMAEVLEGAFRPGHFNGVGLIVLKLFNQIRPTRAYFGLKDLQQYLLVRQMVADFSLNLEVIGLPTIRETSGLALSSRNSRLSAKGREIAISISQGLKIGQTLLESGKSTDETKHTLFTFYSQVSGLDIEYLEVVDVNDLSPAQSQTPTDSLAVCVAAFVEGVRLIDNVYLRHH